MKKPTICTVTATHNTPYSTLLAITSLLKYNPDFNFKVHVIDRGEPDEITEELVSPYCYVYHKDPTLVKTGWTYHGTAITLFCKEYLTEEDEYFLTMDSDIYSFHDGGVKLLYDALQKDPKLYAACSEVIKDKLLTQNYAPVTFEEAEKADPYSYFLVPGQTNLWYSLRRNDADFRKVLKHFSFDTGLQCGIGPSLSNYICQQQFDNGTLISLAMNLLGRTRVQVKKATTCFIHGHSVTIKPGKYKSMEDDLERQCEEIDVSSFDNYITK